MDTNKNDHDLLIELKVMVGELRKDIKDLATSTTAMIADHEKRIRRLETLGLVAVGILAAVEFYFKYLHK